MRCLTLAEALRNDGAACQFLSRGLPGHLIETIRGRGFPVEVLSDLTDAPQSRSPDGLEPAMQPGSGRTGQATRVKAAPFWKVRPLIG